ncbi:hypothetical protein LWI29_023403 [Acer saccharum]|uniref:Transposase-associated domain-containing protein n=1 Tax=Acer saccharum TaxID=4024 RepID=A0AA39S639_ACESA|nr:hypothetical protein LWI29_023403 [Acer saccharum]
MSKDRLSKEYVDGVDQFLAFASAHTTDSELMRCPCQSCANLKFKTPREIKYHLFSKGIDQRYTSWIWHGEATYTRGYTSGKATFVESSMYKDTTNMEELKNKSNESSLSLDGDNDILTIALGTKEHSGRVRGMGKFITPSVFFNAINHQEKWIEERKAYVSRISYLEETLAAFTQSPSQSQNMSTPTADANLEGHSSNKIQHVETTKMIAQDINHTVGDKCALSLGDLCKLIVRPLGDVVAMGTIVENQSGYNTVSIDVVVDEDASLPIPNEVEGLIFFRDALGHQTLWLKELILVESMFNGKTIYTQDEVDEVRLEWFEHVKLSIS